MKGFVILNRTLALVAVVLGAVVGVMYLFEETLRAPFIIAGYCALGLSALYVVLNTVPFLMSFRKRSVRESASLIVLVPFLFGALAMVYLIADGHKVRFDMTASQKFTLSPQSTALVAALTSDVRFLCFFKDGQPGREEVKTLLEQYGIHSKHIRIEFIDPDRYPSKAKEQVIENLGEIIVLGPNGRERINEEVSEQIITNALLKVTAAAKTKVYFVTGHNEPSLDDLTRGGLGLLKKHLELENYEVAPLSLMRTPALSVSGTCLVLATPKTDLFDEEIAFLNAYTRRDGGRLAILADTDAPATFRDLLSSLGLTLGNDVIIDKMSQIFGAQFDVAVIGQYAAEHPITSRFNAASFFPASSSLLIAPTMPDGIAATPFAFSGPGSWAEHDLTTLKESGKATYDAQTDTPGPLPVAAALTMTLPAATAPDTAVSPSDQQPKREGRVVVFGDADFITNSSLRISGNKDLFLNALAWLTGDETLISIRPKVPQSSPLFLRKGQNRLIFFMAVVIVPGTVLALGVVVFLRRRRS